MPLDIASRMSAGSLQENRLLCVRLSGRTSKIRARGSQNSKTVAISSKSSPPRAAAGEENFIFLVFEAFKTNYVFYTGFKAIPLRCGGWGFYGDFFGASLEVI